MTHPLLAKPEDLVSTAKVGDIVSVWGRDSKRHKWRMEYGFCMINYIEDDEVAIQTSKSFNHHEMSGCTGFCLKGEGTWERKLCKPVFAKTPNIRFLK